MTGSVKAVPGKRDTYDLRFERGFERDINGVRRRRQRSIRFHGTKKQADAKLRELVGDVETGKDVEPSKDALLDWCREWLKVYIVPRSRPNTIRLYTMVVTEHVATSDIALIQLQGLRPQHIERWHNELAAKKLEAATLAIYSGVLRTALAKATKLRRIAVNPAKDVDRPSAKKNRVNAEQCWSGPDARRVLAYAKEHASAQLFCYVALALDSGARKSELHGLAWSSVDLDRATVTICRQLDTVTPPTYGPTKTSTSRVIHIAPETIAGLRKHRLVQNELKLRNGQAYNDNGLVFAKEWEDVGRGAARLGDPIVSLSEHRFQKLADAAGVKQITFHFVRHTSATLALAARVPVTAVSKRLGHSKVSMTLDVYSHLLPDDAIDAAGVLASVLWNRAAGSQG